MNLKSTLEQMHLLHIRSLTRQEFLLGSLYKKQPSGPIKPNTTSIFQTPLGPRPSVTIIRGVLISEGQG